MDKKDWYDCGAQIGDLVQSAIENQDFRQLNKTITDVVNKAVSGLMGEKSEAGSERNRTGLSPGSRFGEYRERGTAYQAARKRAGNMDLLDVISRSLAENGSSKRGVRQGKGESGSLRGLASMVTGYSMAAITGIGAVTFGMLSIFVHSGFWFMTVILGIITALFALLGNKGSSYRARSRRMKQYLRTMGDRDTITIEELAAASGQSEKKVRADLKEMIAEGMFPDTAYMDAEETCLMTSHSAYLQYKETMQDAKRAMREKQHQEAARREAERSMASLSDETQKILQEGREFIEHIHECNDRIEEEEMSEKLDQLEFVVTRIFEQVAAKPASAPDLHKMMSYYLPITRKLVDAYADLGNEQLKGENINRTRSEIKLSLDTINGAFEAFLDSFFEDTAWDISSDISTLKTMMARDGLTGRKDFVPGEHIKTVGPDLDQNARNASASAASGFAAAAASKGAGGAAAMQEKEP